MLHTLVTKTTTLAAKGGGLDSNGIHTWVEKNIVPLMLLFVGLSIVAVAKKKDVPGSLLIGAVVLVGLTMVVSSQGWMGFAEGFGGVVFGG